MARSALNCYFCCLRRASSLRAEQPQRAVSHGMALVGHRGASAVKPENTLGALRKGWDDGSDGGVEFDLQQLADGSLVMLHDNTLRRTAQLPADAPDSGTSASILDVPVGQLTWDQVSNVDVGGECMSRFGDVLQEMARRPATAFCFAELKGNSSAAMVEEVARVAQSEGTSHRQLVFISFNPEICASLKRLMPSHNVLLIRLCASISAAMQTITEAKELGLNGIDLFADPRVVTRNVVDAAHEQGLLVAVWAMGHPAPNDDEFAWSSMHANGVDMFTSNLPDEIHAWVAKRNPCKGFHDYWLSRQKSDSQSQTAWS